MAKKLIEEMEPELEKELDAVVAWGLREEEKVIKELKARGEWRDQGDGEARELKESRNEANRRMRAIVEKYGYGWQDDSGK